MSICNNFFLNRIILIAIEIGMIRKCFKFQDIHFPTAERRNYIEKIYNFKGSLIFLSKTALFSHIIIYHLFNILIIIIKANWTIEEFFIEPIISHIMYYFQQFYYSITSFLNCTLECFSCKYIIHNFIKFVINKFRFLNCPIFYLY